MLKIVKSQGLNPKPASKWVSTERRGSKEFTGTPKAHSALANIMESLETSTERLLDRMNRPGLTDYSHIPVPKARSMPELASSMQLCEFPDDAIDSNPGDSAHAQSDSEDAPSGPILDVPAAFKTKDTVDTKDEQVLKEDKNVQKDVKERKVSGPKPKISQKPDLDIKTLSPKSPSADSKPFADTKLSKPVPKSPKPVEIPKVTKLSVDTKTANVTAKGPKPVISPKKPKRIIREQKVDVNENNNAAKVAVQKSDKEEKEDGKKETKEEDPDDAKVSVVKFLVCQDFWCIYIMPN